MNSIFVIVTGILAISKSAESCTNPKFSNIRTSVTQDTKLNTETAYIVGFNVQCAKNSKNEFFYGEIDGKFIAASTDETGEKHQISWTESHKKARTGEITIRIFDEDGFGEAKKIQRNNGDLSKLKELKTVSFYHKGAFSTFHIQNELVAVAIFAVLFYYVQSIRDSF